MCIRDSDDTDWNLVLVNYENAIPENYEPKLVEVPGGEKVDERIYDPVSYTHLDVYKRQGYKICGRYFPW